MTKTDLFRIHTIRKHVPCPACKTTSIPLSLSLSSPNRDGHPVGILVLSFGQHPMGFFSRWFSKVRLPAYPMTLVAYPPPLFLISQGESDDYEQILASLELDIQKRQTRLSEIRLRERRTTLKVTLYTLAFWVVYVSLWYAQVLPNGHRPNTAFEKFVKGVPVLIGPIL